MNEEEDVLCHYRRIPIILLDYGIKLFKYRTAGVREYWIVNPQKRTIMVYDFEKERRSNQYNMEDDIPVCIYEDFIINVNELME